MKNKRNEAWWGDACPIHGDSRNFNGIQEISEKPEF
jgi:hypothetical protein